MKDRGIEWRNLEEVKPAIRSIYERAYSADPKKTHADLVASGLTSIASQLQIDFDAGRLTA